MNVRNQTESMLLAGRATFDRIHLLRLKAKVDMFEEKKDIFPRFPFLSNHQHHSQGSN
jgi:hypothetical protein